MKPAVALLLAMALIVAGCGKPTTACAGRDKEVTICVNGRSISFAEARNGPHGHEAGSLYAPAWVLGDALGVDVRTQVSPDGKSAIITVGGKPFSPAMAGSAQGVHVHDGEVFVPLREFAAAAGLKLDLDVEKGVAGFAR